MVSVNDAPGDGSNGVAERMGFTPGLVVLEIGADTDADEQLRTAIETSVGTPMLGEESDDVADLVVLWWRDDDGDLVDALVDALSSIASGGVVWLFTPKAGRDGHVEPSEIGEAARTAGLSCPRYNSCQSHVVNASVSQIRTRFAFRASMSSIACCVSAMCTKSWLP